MFGWEFPPHISGGLGTACLGIAQGLAKNGVQVLFVMPKASGDEDGSVAKIINASDVEMLQNTEKIEDFWKHINFMEIGSNLVPYLDPETFARERDQYLKEGEHRQRISYQNKFQFSGKYGANLMEEVYRYALVAGTVAKRYEFDVIHAHDWLPLLPLEADADPGDGEVQHLGRKPDLAALQEPKLGKEPASHPRKSALIVSLPVVFRQRPSSIRQGHIGIWEALIKSAFPLLY